MPELRRSCCLLATLVVLVKPGFAQEAQPPVEQEQQLKGPVVNIPRIERDPIPDLGPQSLMERSIGIVDGAHGQASDRFGNLMGRIDQFFSAGSDDDVISNTSVIRLRFDGLYVSNEGFSLDPSIKVRVTLPQTEEKLKLLVSTEGDDQEDNINPNESVQGEQSGSIALRFIKSARKTSDLNLDIGVRRRDGLVQYFGRINNRFEFDFSDTWCLRLSNSYRYFNKSGYQNILSFDARRLLFKKENIYFQTRTDVNWEQGQEGASIGNRTGFYWFVDEKRSVALESLSTYFTELSEEVEDRFRGYELRIRWRHNIWRPWFFYEIWPSLAYPSENDYQQQERLLLRAEILIGNLKN